MRIFVDIKEMLIISTIVLDFPRPVCFLHPVYVKGVAGVHFHLIFFLVNVVWSQSFKSQYIS